MSRLARRLMTIVPDNQPLVLSVRVSPSDIEHIRRGQETQVQFPAAFFPESPTIGSFGT